MSDNRPLDALDEAKGKRVIVKIRPQGEQEKGSEIVGTLKAFDLHLNLWLENTERKEDGKTTKFGTVVVRGDNVLFVSPE
ncbi:MAG: LSM domain-containing protein [Candidatus Aenigmatarchaeota archaeon]